MQKTSTYLLSLLFLFSNPCDGSESQIRIAVPTKLNNVDPVLMWNTSEMILVASYCRPLTKIDVNGEITGELVKRWKISKDFREYTFYLRDSIKFHDGSILTSRDVVNSISRHYWQKYDSGYRHHLAFFTGTSKKIKSGEFIKSFEIVGPKIFKIKTQRPYLPLLSMLSQTGLCIVKKDFPYVGSGPMTVEKHTSGNGWLLKRFKDYSGEKSKAKEIYVYSEYNAEKAQSMIKSGTLDLAIGSLFTDTGNIPIEPDNLFGFVSINHFLINVKHQAFTKQKARKAIGQLLQYLAWKKENVPWTQNKSPSLVPTGFFSNAVKNENLEYSKILDNLNRIQFDLKQPIEIALINKHFSDSFFIELDQTLKDLKIPFKLRKIEAQEWYPILKAGSYSITHYPMQPSFYDPDGMFISLKNLFPKEEQYLFEEMSQFRNLTSKNKRIHGYIDGLRKIQDTWIIVPAYRKLAPYLKSNKLVLPKTSFRNQFEAWNISKTK